MNQKEPAKVHSTTPRVLPGTGRPTTPLSRRLLTPVLAACLGVSLLTACSAVPELDNGVAGRFQTRVAVAKQLVAQQNFPAALAELQLLNRDVTTAAEQGKVSEQRKARIEAAISTIKNELEAAMTPTPQPVPTAPAADPPNSDGKKQEEDAKKEAEKQQQEERPKEDEKEKDKGKGND
jgi:ribosomal protein L12E/L44/L45/RPP1/RPP2